jgi:hypothetical protein
VREESSQRFVLSNFVILVNVDSGEFAESRSVGLAVGCWLQVLLVGFPAMYLVGPEDIVAAYFLQVGLLFVLCMSMMLIIFGPLVMMVLKYKHNPGDTVRRARGSVRVSGASQIESGPYYGTTVSGGSTHNLDSTHNVSGNLRTLQAMGAMRSDTRHSFAGHDEMCLQDMIAITTFKTNPSVNDNGTSERSFNVSKPFSLPEACHGYEGMGKTEIDDSFQRHQVSDIHEESESACASSIASLDSPAQEAEEKPPLEAWADSIASITCPEQQVTQEMLLLDLVPKESADQYLHESDSSVPFCGGDFLSDNNLLGDDSSDSSVPFQGTRSLLEDDSSSLEDSIERHRLAKEGSAVSDIPITGLVNPAIHAGLSSKYNQHLIHSLSASNHKSQSSLKDAETTQGKSVIPTASMSPMISTVENHKTTEQTEMPFSSRFVSYKNRLSFLRSEDGTLSTGESPSRETISEESIRRMNDSSLTSLKGTSDRGGMKDTSDRGGRRHNFQKMNDYIVQSIRDSGERHEVFIEKADRMGNGSSRMSGSARMMDGSGRVGTRQSMKESSTKDRSNQSTSSRASLSQRKADPDDHTRRRIQQADDEDDEVFPWDKNGEATSASKKLGYQLSDEWQDVAGGTPSKKKKSAIKSTLSALHQSMSAFQFSPGDSINPKKGRKNPFAALNLSVPALHYTHGGRDDDDDDDEEEEDQKGEEEGYEISNPDEY